MSSRITQSALSMLQIRIWATNMYDNLPLAMKTLGMHVWSDVLPRGRAIFLFYVHHLHKTVVGPGASVYSH